MTQHEWLLWYAKIGFGLGVFSTVIRLMLLAWKDYPRTLTYSRDEDALAVALNCVLLPFMWWIIWG